MLLYIIELLESYKLPDTLRLHALEGHVALLVQISKLESEKFPIDIYKLLLADTVVKK